MATTWNIPPPPAMWWSAAWCCGRGCGSDPHSVIAVKPHPADDELPGRQAQVAALVVVVAVQHPIPFPGAVHEMAFLDALDAGDGIGGAVRAEGDEEAGAGDDEFVRPGLQDKAAMGARNFHILALAGGDGRRLFEAHIEHPVTEGETLGRQIRRTLEGRRRRDAGDPGGALAGQDQ